MGINVLHLIDTDRVSGPGKTIMESARSLHDTEFRVTIAAHNFGKEHKNPYLDQVNAQGFDQVLIPIRNQYDPEVVTRLIRVLKEKRIDIVHTHGYKSDLFGLIAARLCGIKAVSTVHGWIQNNLRAKLYVRMDKFLLRWFDRVIAVSDRIREALLQAGIPGRKLVTIHNAINLERYSPDLGSDILRKQYGLSSRNNLIGTIGRLSPEKGQKDFLDAAKLTLNHVNGCYFFVIGEGSDNKYLTNYAKLLGIETRVKFTGHRSDMIDVYKSIDIIVNPSYTEGLPNVVLEAMAMNRPVIATPVGGVPEIIFHGKTGLLVEQKSPNELANSVRFLLENPNQREQIIRSARVLIERQFSFHQRMEKIKSLYHELF